MSKSNRITKQIRKGGDSRSECRSVEPLVELDGGVITCYQHYRGIDETCPNEATHVLVMEFELPDVGGTETILEPYCDDCGLPEFVDWDAEPVKLPNDWW